MKNKWIRAAMAGATIDGREITESQIQQMAATYDSDVYQAKIWLEHQRGIFPDGVFKSLGNVIAVRATRIKSGALKSKLALEVQLNPSPELVQMVRNDQKTHLSIEMMPEFPETQGAYLIGVGVTDTPASLGTGMMKFSVEKHHTNLFSDLIPCELEPYVAQVPNSGEIDQIADLVIQKLNAKNFATSLPQSQNSEVAELSQKVDQLINMFKKFGEQPNPNTPVFPENTGGSDPWAYERVDY